MESERQNWARNLTYRSQRVAKPESVEELREIVSAEPSIKALGTRHAFNDVADTDGVHISLRNQTEIFGLDEKRQTVRIQGGVRYGELGTWLHERGWALANLASLPHISVAGAIATATHGSGDRLGCLSTAVRALTFVLANGSLWRVEESDPDFGAAVVTLGALGVIAELELTVEPTYSVAQTVYEALPYAALEAHFDEVTRAATSVSLFTTWTGDSVDQVWLKSREGDSVPDELFGAKKASRKLHPIRAIDPVHCTEQLGVPGAWHERLPHFRLDHTPSSGEELQAEYLFPRENALEAIRRIRRLSNRIAALLQISEIRTIAADRLGLSPFCGRDSVGIHFTWRQTDAVLAFLPELEDAIADLLPRPHWAKLFHRLPNDIPGLDAFRTLTRRLDPQGKFRNRFLDRLLG